MTPRIRFDNSYAKLPAGFFADVLPTPVPAPRLLKLNAPLAVRLGMDPQELAAPEGIAVLAGARVPEGASPIAMAYAGHQFGQFVPQLGDGRAILLGEVIDAEGTRRDVQLKGSGPTPFSRRGDGRAALGPVLREYIVSEAMAALGIPTTRALAAVATGDTVWRERGQPGAVLTRIASSHIRIGTFQYFAARKDAAAVRRLADYTIARHYPALAEAPQPYAALLEAVAERQAELVARWMLVGFIHGVMNTDNMSVAGETIDYGPCAFMDAYDPQTVFSSIDDFGRYAYENQPRIAHWNLARFAECLIPLLDTVRDTAVDRANGALAGFPELFRRAHLAQARRKLGLLREDEADAALFANLLSAMAAGRADFTLTFRRLADAADDAAALAQVRALFAAPEAFDAWAARWRGRLDAEAARGQAGDGQARGAAMRRVNPAFIPRNHRIEAALAAAGEGDLAPFETLLQVLSAPYDAQPAFAGYAEAPPAEFGPYRTFCGT